MKFRRSDVTAELERFQRADVSLVSEVIGLISASRTDGLPVPVTELPITVGASTLHADTVAAMPARIGWGRPETAQSPPRVRDFLARPDVDTDYRAFIHSTCMAMYWKGYAALLLDRPAPGTTSATVLDPREVTWSASTGWRVNAEYVPDELIYQVALYNDPSRGPLGESPLVRCHQALEMYGWAYRFMIDYFAQGGPPSQILKSSHALGNATDATTGKTRAQTIVEEWITSRQERRPAVMDPTISLEIPTSNGELAASLEVLDHCSAEVARLLNMPASLVNAPSSGYSLTYANIADEMRRWIALSLKPTWMGRIESMFRTLTGDPTVYLDPSDLLATYAMLAPSETVPA